MNNFGKRGATTPSQGERKQTRQYRKPLSWAVFGLTLCAVTWLVVTDTTNPTAAEQTAYSSNDLRKFVGGSDDLHKHQKAFEEAAIRLIEEGACNPADFIETAGFIRSTQDRGAYFTYCGGYDHVRYRIYLDVETGRTYK